MTWKRLTTRTVYENDWITVLEDDVTSDREAVVEFDATIPGIFEIELEAAGVLIGELQVLHIDETVRAVRAADTLVGHFQHAAAQIGDEIVGQVAAEHRRVVAGPAVERIVARGADEEVVTVVADEDIVAAEAQQVVVLAVALQAGCPTTSTEDAKVGPVQKDAAVADDGAVDDGASSPDAGPGDSASADLAPPDSAGADLAVPDSAGQDLALPDSASADAASPDSGSADVARPDSGPPDASPGPEGDTTDRLTVGGAVRAVW